MSAKGDERKVSGHETGSRVARRGRPGWSGAGAAARRGKEGQAGAVRWDRREDGEEALQLPEQREAALPEGEGRLASHPCLAPRKACAGAGRARSSGRGQEELGAGLVPHLEPLGGESMGGYCMG